MQARHLLLAAWACIALTVIFAFGFYVPSLMTIVGLLSLMNLYWTGTRPGHNAARISALSAAATGAIAVAYRAGPTSGFQEVNLILLLAAVIAFALSIVLARRS